ncbi:sulfotransferase family protein [Dyella mobilis]|uniref:Sulfotransferase family protein n=1 Tax=Dyella mobilis TaxID=1849582 RepID=A0ABS2KJV3_9GAMM|nr:hypothetical protein [Dyella mobilis]MBM7131445.1 hypothetical protein [Dyella mobilis]GLQ96582.1 hypothetical protein GCM10007863_10000 [Dyella mobilis]
MTSHTQRPRALLILGMHRSGTSAVTRAINLLGAHIGKNILLPGQGNSEGFWEHFDALEANHHLLDALGRTWFDVRRLPPDWLMQAPGRDMLACIQAVIQKEFAPHRLVALKDPRLCLTAPAWVEAFQSAGYAVQCLLVIRDPREVADSLHTREKWPRDSVFLLWSHYVTEALLETRGCVRALITYDQLLADWRSTLHGVSEALSLHWPRSEETAATDIDAFLHTKHRHHVATPLSGTEPSFDGMPSLTAELYANCLAVAHGRSDWTALEHSALTMRDISDLYAPHLDHLLTRHQVAESALTAKLQAYENILKNLVSHVPPKS